MTEIIGLGALVALGLSILLWKINLYFFAKYHWQTDIALSVLLAVIFFGTFKGMVTALVGGIFISIFLWISRLIIRPM